jgi:hypothetical protein
MDLYNLRIKNILPRPMLLQELAKAAFSQMHPMTEIPAILVVIFFVSFLVDFS